MDTGKKNNEIFKRRMESAGQEKSELTQALASLQDRFDTLQLDRDQLQAQTADGPAPDVVAILTTQVDELIREKNALEKSLAEATAANAVEAPSAEIERELVRFRRSSTEGTALTVFHRRSCVNSMRPSWLRKKRGPRPLPLLLLLARLTQPPLRRCGLSGRLRSRKS
jgi:hypothetical protein